MDRAAILKADAEIFAQYRREAEEEIKTLERWKRDAVRRIPILQAKIDDLSARFAKADSALEAFDPDECDIFDEKGWMIRRMSDEKRAALSAATKLAADLKVERGWLLDAERDATGHPERMAQLVAARDDWRGKEEACRCGAGQ